MNYDLMPSFEPFPSWKPTKEYIEAMKKGIEGEFKKWKRLRKLSKRRMSLIKVERKRVKNERKRKLRLSREGFEKVFMTKMINPKGGVSYV